MRIAIMLLLFVPTLANALNFETVKISCTVTTQDAQLVSCGMSWSNDGHAIVSPASEDIAEKLASLDWRQYSYYGCVVKMGPFVAEARSIFDLQDCHPIR